MNYLRNKYNRFYNTNQIIIDNAKLALPSILHSHRSGSDRRFVNTKTVDFCENNPEEIGFLLRNIPEQELNLLHLYDIDDLILTYGGPKGEYGLYYGVGWFEQIAEEQKRKHKTGRWNLETPITIKV